MPRRTSHIDLARIGVGLAFGLLATIAGQGRPAAQDSLVVACRPDASVAQLGKRVTLRAFTTPVPDAVSAPTFLWKASAGVLTGEGATVDWQLPAAQPGVYTATVDVRQSSSGATCTVRLFVLKVDPERSTETRRRFLVTGQGEERRFRRYSYILLGAPPSDELTRRRYLSALAAYRSILPVPDELQKDLNITVLPLKIAPPTEADAPAAEWLFTNYDWERARDFLKRVPGDHLDGPYIVTYREPLSDVDILEKEYLYQDLSRVPPDLVAAWVREFVLQAAQEHFWEARTGPMLALKLRTVIDVLASALPDAKSVAASIAWR